MSRLRESEYLADCDSCGRSTAKPVQNGDRCPSCSEGTFVLRTGNRAMPEGAWRDEAEFWFFSVVGRAAMGDVECLRMVRCAAACLRALNDPGEPWVAEAARSPEGGA